MSVEKVTSKFQIDINTFAFNRHSINNFQESAEDLWPVVYFIEEVRNNLLEAYVGESTDAYRRMTNHLQNPIRKDLSKLFI